MVVGFCGQAASSMLPYPSIQQLAMTLLKRFWTD